MSTSKIPRAAEERETPEQYKQRVTGMPLRIEGKSTNQIWCMEDIEGLIGIRLDCGDSGTVYLTHDQARDLAHQLTLMTRIEGISASI